ncbi:hypothetical protein [Zobellia russellii]|uniref:hypothetical protein n=1 Tax=Zobellia russellii TaxID=248907 RepID=UPI0037DD4DFD
MTITLLETVLFKIFILTMRTSFRRSVLFIPKKLSEFRPRTLHLRSAFWYGEEDEEHPKCHLVYKE